LKTAFSAGSVHLNLSVETDPDSNVPVPIGSEYLGSALIDPRHNLWVRVAEAVSISYADQCDLRMGNGKEFGRSRSSAPVVTDFEYSERGNLMEYFVLHCSGSITCKEDGPLPPPDQEDDRQIIRICEMRTLRDFLARVKNIDGYSVDLHGHPSPRSPPRPSFAFGFLKKSEIGVRPMGT
jgi:hypothetical protein